jgi:hypothetical protein
MDLPSFADLDRRAAAAGLSKRTIVRRLNIGLSTYYRWLNRETEPTHSQFVAFLELVGTAEREDVA